LSPHINQEIEGIVSDRFQKHRPEMLKKTVKPVDKIIGQNIRANRLAQRLSQGELAERIGVTFQQVQKYEKGANRVGGSRLIQIAKALNIAVVALFEGAEAGPLHVHSELPGLIVNQHAIRMLRAISKIKRNSSLQALVTLAEAMAADL
jgi:transcriptional regulator with XRE-family HTH domain